MIEIGEVEEIEKIGGVGEMIGNLLNENGKWMEKEMKGRKIED